MHPSNKIGAMFAIVCSIKFKNNPCLGLNTLMSAGVKAGAHNTVERASHSSVKSILSIHDTNVILPGKICNNYIVIT